MFKIKTALVTGVIAALIVILSAISADIRFSTAMGRSLVVLFIVAGLVYLIVFFLEKKFPMLFAQADELEIPSAEKENELSMANDTDSARDAMDVEEDGEAANAASQEQDVEPQVMENPSSTAAISQGE